MFIAAHVVRFGLGLRFCRGVIMGEVIQFKRPKVSELHKGKTLCRSGFHKWEILQEKQFDVKQGKLITVYRCKRCAIIKTKGL
ncbi:MAG: hypothetical protein ACXWF8_00320 [Methylobacter sp.]